MKEKRDRLDFFIILSVVTNLIIAIACLITGDDKAINYISASVIMVIWYEVRGLKGSNYEQSSFKHYKNTNAKRFRRVIAGLS